MFGKGAMFSITLLLIAVFVRNYKNLNRLKAPIVKTSSGKLQGVISFSRNGRHFFEYLAIPFAKPPVGDLRFEPPEPAGKWDGVRDASNYGPKCIQFDLLFGQIEGEENCLQLNLHRPMIIGPEQEFLPVMVWFHGGLFHFGSSILYRPEYFMDEDVVLVTVNYRLGSFGFFNTGDGIIRGNMGLKDQNLALRWVQENVEKFGGNPNSVTIFGESAGGVSAHFHMLSPASRGLFHKIITQSGMSTMPFALQNLPAIQATKFAEKLNCTTSDTKVMAACLKRRSEFEIASVHLETMDPLRETISIFVPTIELNISDGKTFLAESPETLLNSGRFAKVPFLSGINSHEGLISSAILYRNETAINLVISEWQKWIPRLLYLPENTAPKVLNKLKEFYLQDGPSSNRTSFRYFENITNMFSARFWNVNFHNSIKSQVKYSSPRSPIYLYYYTYNGQFSLTDILLALKGEYHPVAEIVISMIKTWVATTHFGVEAPRFGVCHGDEIPMQFYIPLTSLSPNSMDSKFSKDMVKTWAMFAKLSPQAPYLTFMGREWIPQTTNETLKYMKLDSIPSMISEPFGKEVAFWNSIMTNSLYPEQ